MAQKQTSAAVSEIASRVLKAGNPLLKNRRLRHDIGMMVMTEMGKPANDAVSKLKPETIADWIAPLLTPFFDDAARLAGSALSQDETK